MPTGAQIWRLTQAVQADLARVESDGLADRLPPIRAIQSVADATIVARSTAPGAASPTTTKLNLSWPADVYSLSHVAIPLPPDDLLYGYLDVPGRESHRVPIGRLALRGERDVLRVSPVRLLRLRPNPFHAYMLRRIGEALETTR